MKRFEIIVDEIYSYQSGIYKRGYNSFTKPHFKTYQDEVLYKLPNLQIDENAQIIVKLDFFFKLPKSYSKKKKEALKLKYCLKNIDLDNASKGIIDVIAKKYDFNDKNIVDLHIRKFWNDEEENKIKIEIGENYGSL